MENIAIITTVSNWELYEKTKKFFPSNIQVFTIDGTNGFFGLQSLLFSIEKLRKYEIDWLIMADEDVIFTKPEKVFELISYLGKANYVACGMRDGGAIKWRNKNPFVINHFFAILHLKEIFPIFDKKEIISNQYILKNEFSSEIEDVPFRNYDINSLAESYYCFYLWLLRSGKRFLFLDAENPISKDFATTCLKDINGKIFLFHTWYARFYGKDKFHTARINKVLEMTGKIGSMDLNNHYLPIRLENPWYDTKFFIYKYYRRFLRKINLIN